MQREEYLAAQAHQQNALATQVKREIEWLRRGPQARTTKAQGRIQQAERMIGELAEVKFRNAQDRSAGIDFSASGPADARAAGRQGRRQEPRRARRCSGI